VIGVLRLGEGTPSYDAETEVDELLPWEHVTGKATCCQQEGTSWLACALKWSGLMAKGLG